MIELYNNDCFLQLQILAADGVKVDAVICDPPYNINYADWDTSFEIEKAVELCCELLNPNANVILFQGYSNVISTKLMLDKYLVFRNWIVYDRLKGLGGLRNLTSTREDILWYSKGNDYTFNKVYSENLKATRGHSGIGSKNGQVFRALTNVWYDISPIVPWGAEHTEHPTQKPLKLMERCVKLWTNEGDTVLDFTMGSGTTGVACKKLKRSFIGIEKDTHWFNVAKNRIDSLKLSKSFF